MKTILQYLQEQKEMAWHNRLCYSKTYGMDTPKEGYARNFVEAVRDCEIIEELIALVQEKETPIVQTSSCGCQLKREWKKLIQLLKEVDDYIQNSFL